MHRKRQTSKHIKVNIVYTKLTGISSHMLCLDPFHNFVWATWPQCLLLAYGMMREKNQPPDEFIKLKGGPRMFNRKQDISRTLFLLLANVLLALVMVACGSSGGSGSASTPTPKPSPTPTSAPLTVYHGTGFTISYPQGWKVTVNGTSGVEFTDPTTVYTMIIDSVADPNGLISADTIVSTTISSTKSGLTNIQPETIAPTAIVGGDTWSQKAESGDATKNGKKMTAKFVVIGDTHPANSASTKAFIIVYATNNKSMFDSANATYFQPMLQTFTFV
jgi:hypothetical protein